MNFFFKIGVPSWEEVKCWGDYHLVKAMGKELEKRGHHFKIQILPEWKGSADRLSDITIHVRGLSKYKTKPGPMNIMWLISHSDKITSEEYELYDHIFVASHQYVDKLSKEISKPVTSLLQCTDTNLFYPELADQVTEHKGTHIKNTELRLYYSKCGVLLNGHWPSMGDSGFISNRIFDAVACVVSDSVSGMEALFGDVVTTCQDAGELKSIVSDLLSNDHKRRVCGEKLKESRFYVNCNLL